MYVWALSNVVKHTITSSLVVLTDNVAPSFVLFKSLINVFRFRKSFFCGKSISLSTMRNFRKNPQWNKIIQTFPQALYCRKLSVTFLKYFLLRLRKWNHSFVLRKLSRKSVIQEQVMSTFFSRKKRFVFETSLGYFTTYMACFCFVFIFT